MARGFADALALFLLPFAVYGLLVALQRRTALIGPQWTSGRLVLLSLAGLGAVLAGLVLFGFLAPRGEGVYVPAHLEDGRLVPGVLR